MIASALQTERTAELHRHTCDETMFRKRLKTDHDGLFKGVVVAHAILALHLLMIAGLGLTVVFLTGLAHYMSWIVLGGMAILAVSSYLFYRRIRKEGKSVGEALQMPLFQGREVEIRLLGGFASLKLGKPAQRSVDSGAFEPPLQLESPESSRIREIAALAQLLEKDLITREEYDQAKRRLLH
jgi:hypothetical protein